jgi:hypothetical protein
MGFPSHPRGWFSSIVYLFVVYVPLSIYRAQENSLRPKALEAIVLLKPLTL